MCRSRALLLAATIVCALALARPSRADGLLSAQPVPPVPSPAQVERGTQQLGNPLNKPVTGAANHHRWLAVKARRRSRRCRRRGRVTSMATG